MMIKTIAVLFSMTALTAAADWVPQFDEVMRRLDEYGFIGWVNPEIASAYTSRGKIFSDRPCWSMDTGLGFSAGKWGSLVAGVWMSGDLHDKGGQLKRPAFHETDWFLRYEYDYQFAEGWSLNSQAAAQWDEMVCMRGETKRTSPRTYTEWIWREELRNPYVTPYLLVRTMVHPFYSPAMRIGVWHRFPIIDKLSFTPHLYVDGGTERWNRRRFPQYYEGTSHYRYGPTVATIQLKLSYSFTDNFSVYAVVEQYGAISENVRHQLKANPTMTGHRDLTVGRIGLDYSF